MKNVKFYVLVLLLAAAVSCKKDDNGSVKIKGNVSNDEAADMVAASMSSNFNGVAGVSGDVTVSAQAFVNVHLACGATKSDSVSRSYNGSQVSYNYKLKYSYTLNCNSNNVPDNLSSNLTYSGSYDGPSIASSNSGSSSFTVAGLASAATNFSISGEYKRDGSFKSKVDTTNAGSSHIDINVKSLVLTKPNRKIASGSATFTITGNVPKKGDFSFTGSIVFNGDGTANLTVNGTVYIVNLETGEKNRK
jgi:hypothetical protein